jgi:hypothetical protein
MIKKIYKLYNSMKVELLLPPIFVLHPGKLYRRLLERPQGIKKEARGKTIKYRRSKNREEERAFDRRDRCNDRFSRNDRGYKGDP